ncbi:hypothetical protein LNQ49_17810 [Flavobacterium sp. F-65]|uniref:Uncharacterized protein n=1 Tax=Flavobacterium pisciphilum TaxID=2893755 RepID=A0ABS8MXC9_9FLAO|nr:hypothetical protein [Flavobacterium sp. F-65]MCC9073434.1 hypothetical protein [Flavobacterium sp. F-65]
MKNKKYFIILGIILFLIFATYYWDNRFVKLQPVITKEYTRQIITFETDLYKIAKPNEVPENYYKNIKYVIDRSGQDYMVKKGEIYVRHKLMKDLNLIWNYTTRTSDARYFEEIREMDSINLSNHKRYEDSIKKK